MGGRRTVLVVEDDEAIAASLCDVLGDEGYPVRVARDGAHALALLRHEPAPGLILLDLMMPDMDGKELRRRQLADARLAAIPTWVVTAGGTEYVRHLAVEGWLRKPIPLTTLLAVVERYCGEDDHRHVVEFYRAPETLAANVARFVGEGIAAGESAVLITVPERWPALERLLAARSLAVGALREQGRLVLRDARETLETVLRDGLPHPILFGRTVGSVVDAAVAAAPLARVRAYGEMVDLLWQRGDEQPALQLENLWNRLLDGKPVSLYCSYQVAGAPPPAVAARHTRAIAS